ncbi:MAG: hypothetical protein Q8N63_04455 [Nanoarchaeota archaeon]|nr:hypothetical protein [Nanoarchaeota archaeon]
MLRNKKAAIGATITWVVATIIILLVIIIFVYAAKVQSIGSEKGSFYTRYKLTQTNKQQILLALLKTEIEGKIVQDYIVLEDYESLKNKIKPVLEKLPGHPNGNWIFVVYDDKKEALRVGEVSSVVRDINPSFVYFSNKKIELSFDYLPVDI